MRSRSEVAKILIDNCDNLTGGICSLSYRLYAEKKLTVEEFEDVLDALRDYANGKQLKTLYWSKGSKVRIKWISNVFTPSEEPVIEHMRKRLGWNYHVYYNGRVHVFLSQMSKLSSGRYRVEIVRLKSKRKGCRYKVDVYWTPYNPNNLVSSFRVNTIQELLDNLGSINKNLLNHE